MQKSILILLAFFWMVNMKAQENIIISNGSANLYVSVYSSDKTETIILLHGGPGVPDDMVEVVDVLKEKYRIISFHQRGTGLSDCLNCDYSMEAYIADLDAISDHFNLDSFHVFGHSWGGLYAQIYAQEKPEKISSLFLCSPGSGTNQLWKQTEKEVMLFNKSKSSTSEWINMGWNSLLGMFGSDAAYRKMFAQVLINYHKDYNVDLEKEFDLSFVEAKPINKTRKQILKYPKLLEIGNPHFPIIITYGDMDIYSKSMQSVYKRYPRAEAIIIENSGHIPWKHNLPDFENTLINFYQIQH